jgi:hypothetical protein
MVEAATAVHPAIIWLGVGLLGAIFILWLFDTPSSGNGG